MAVRGRPSDGSYAREGDAAHNIAALQGPWQKGCLKQNHDGNWLSSKALSAGGCGQPCKDGAWQASHTENKPPKMFLPFASFTRRQPY